MRWRRGVESKYASWGTEGVAYVPDGVLAMLPLYWRQQPGGGRERCAAAGHRGRGSTMNEHIRCPNPVCPHPDAVQQVSVVAQTRYALNPSPAAWHLLPPDPPVDRRRPGWSLVARLLFELFALGALVVVIIPFNVLVGHVQVTPALVSRLAPTFFLGVVAVGLMVLTVDGWRRQSARYERNYERYRRARARWEELSYCHGCGSVFHPNEPSRFVPAARLKELLVYYRGAP